MTLINKTTNNFPILETCNLRQAVEYLAFGYDPIEYNYRKDLPKYSSYDVKIFQEGCILLKRLLVESSIKAYGVYGDIEMCLDENNSNDSYIKIFPNKKTDNEHLTLLCDTYVDEDSVCTIEEFYINRLSNVKSDKGNLIEKKQVNNDFCKKADFDYDCSMIAQNLKFSTANSIPGSKIFFQTEGYCLIEINFNELKEWSETSSFQKEKKTKYKDIQDYVENSLPENVISLNKAIDYVRENYVGKSTKGFSPQTIRRALEVMRNEDGSLKFIKQENRGRTPLKSDSQEKNKIKVISKNINLYK